MTIGQFVYVVRKRIKVFFIQSTTYSFIPLPILSLPIFSWALRRPFSFSLITRFHPQLLFFLMSMPAIRPSTPMMMVSYMWHIPEKAHSVSKSLHPFHFPLNLHIFFLYCIFLKQKPDISLTHPYHLTFFLNLPKNHFALIQPINFALAHLKVR